MRRMEESPSLRGRSPGRRDAGRLRQPSHVRGGRNQIRLFLLRREHETFPLGDPQVIRKASLQRELDRMVQIPDGFGQHPHRQIPGQFGDIPRLHNGVQSDGLNDVAQRIERLQARAQHDTNVSDSSPGAPVALRKAVVSEIEQGLSFQRALAESGSFDYVAGLLLTDAASPKIFDLCGCYKPRYHAASWKSSFFSRNHLSDSLFLFRAVTVASATEPFFDQDIPLCF